jgi:hypothetical protein
MKLLTKLSKEFHMIMISGFEIEKKFAKLIKPHLCSFLIFAIILFMISKKFIFSMFDE